MRGDHEQGGGKEVTPPRGKARLLWPLAGLVAAGAAWIAGQAAENLLGDVFNRILARGGPLAEGGLFLACGLGLAFAGPVVMARENRRRLLEEKKPRYGVVEHGVVIVAGILFTLAGAAMLLGYL